jgi:hypothetical protein
MFRWLQNFHKQIIALGAFWIFIGLMTLLVAAAAAFADAAWTPDVGAAAAAGVIGIMGLAWIGLGICVCLKQMWAVRVALVLSYLSMLASLITLQLCAAVILVVVILQAHRVLKWAKQLAAAGVESKYSSAQFLRSAHDA